MRFISWVVVSVVVACVLANEFNDAIMSRDDNGKCGVNLTWTLDNGILRINGTGEMDFSVIGTKKWSPYHDSIKVVEIEEGLTAIDDYAFSQCSNLESINLPSTLISIGFSAFFGCISLPTISIPAGVISLGQGPFTNCTGLVSIEVDPNNRDFKSVDGVLFKTFPNQIVRYPSGKKETSYTVPDGITDMEWSAFSESRNLKTVVLPDSMRTVSSYAFYACSDLETLRIPPNVTALGDHAFDGCISLTNITLNPRINYIGDSTFNNCQSLTEFAIPDSVVTIHNNAFSNCANLKSVKLPSGLDSLPYGAFSNCQSLTDIVIPPTVSSMKDSVFQGCTQLKFVFYQGSSDISADIFSDCPILDTVCVSPDYSSSTFGGVNVTSDKDLCKTFRSLFNRCYAPTYVDGEFVEEMLWTASSWVKQTNGCGKYQCDNNTGNVAWSLCNDTNDASRLCMNSSCIDNWEKALKGWVVDFEYDKLQYEMMSIADIYSEIKKLLSLRSLAEFPVGIESNKDGVVIRNILYVNDNDAAQSIAKAVNALDKGKDCSYGILCKVSQASAQEYKPSGSGSGSGSGASSIHGSMGLVMIVLVAIEMIMFSF